MRNEAMTDHLESNRKRKLLENTSFFNNCSAHILPSALGPKRLKLLETLFQQHGGKIIASLNNKLHIPTHIVVEESILTDPTICLNIIKKAGFDVGKVSSTNILGVQWLTQCIKEKQLICTKPYELLNIASVTICKKNQDEVAVTSLEEHLLSQDVGITTSGEQSRKKQNSDEKSDFLRKFKCSQASGSSSGEQLNCKVTGELQKLADAFRSSGDRWRSFGYEKAISAIKAYPKEITNHEDVRTLPGIGEKMAAKVCEILESGKLRKVDEICGQDRVMAVELFTKVWGVGPSTADSWYLQGFRSLEDLRSKANLTKQQTIGLRYFEEFDLRIPREEVEQIGDMVMNAARTLDPKVTCVVGGSFRRGKPTCGDIDVMIARDTDATQYLSQLVSKLKNEDLITDDLVSLESSGKQKKWLGVCQLPGKDVHRRLDIFVVPRCEFAPALMHYTGSALFNRSIRQLAISKGMSLSEHCLEAGIIRQGKEILNKGSIIPTPTEESIFEALGLEYRPPEERDH